MYFFYEDFFTQNNLDIICDKLQISRHDIILKVINKGHYEKCSEEFINKFGRTKKNIDAVRFIKDKFKHVPWRIEDYINSVNS